MTALVAAIKKIATGPHLSKDLSTGQAREAMTEILLGEADPVQAAIFFIALRMKRETNEENLGVLQAILEQTTQVTARAKQLLILSDPYDGYQRYCPVHAFLPAVLAASGLPTIMQGVHKMAPKFGVTSAEVLAKARIITDLSVEVAAKCIDEAELGWAYIDQSKASPSLYKLRDLRTRMVKRPCLATLEKLVMPIKAATSTHLQVGFVHKAYPPLLAWLAEQVGFASALIVRGIEGGIVPTLARSSSCFTVQLGACKPYHVDPVKLGITPSTRAVKPLSNKVTAEETAHLGLQALAAQSGAAFDSLVLAGALSLHHCGVKPTLQQAAEHVRKIIKSGKAKAHFDRAVT